MLPTQIGVTLFSLTNEFYSRQYNLEQLLARVAALGMGPGLEVVGFQSFRAFPGVSDADAARFREALARHDLKPSCLAINSDSFIRRDRPMTDDEAVAYHEPQIRAAAKLGFPVVRMQFTAPPAVFERLLPLLEALNIKAGPEVHSPMTVNSPLMHAYRERFARLGSPLLGFIPDFGSCATRPPPGFIASFKANGVPQSLLNLLEEVWQSPGDTQTKREEFVRRASATGALPAVFGPLTVLFSIVCPQDPRAWLEIMPQILHVHGKFYEFDAAGRETSIPYEQLLAVFVEGGYRGYISSEYEGTMFSTAGGFEMVQRHQALCRRIIAAAPAAP
jgi:sugar phosphate isomerase/epimerase